MEFRANEIRKIYDVISKYFEWENNFIPNYYDLDPTEQGIYFNHINKGVKFVRDNVFYKYGNGKVSGVVLRKIAHQRLIGWNVVPTDIDIILERLLSFILDEEANEYKELRSILRYVILRDCIRYKKNLKKMNLSLGVYIKFFV